MLGVHHHLAKVDQAKADAAAHALMEACNESFLLRSNNQSSERIAENAEAAGFTRTYIDPTPLSIFPLERYDRA